MSLIKTNLKILGMHCPSCDFLIQTKLGKINGVKKIHSNFKDGRVEIFSESELDIQEINALIQDFGYKAAFWEDERKGGPDDNQKNNLVEIGAIFLIVVAAYLLLGKIGIIPKSFTLSENISYGFVFLIGLTAAFSTCMAVSGGLLLGVAAKYSQRYPNLSSFNKFLPHLYFNVGRIFAYALFGGIIGAIGSAVSLSPNFNGIITIAASVIMILLGLNLLNMAPTLKWLHIKTPSFLDRTLNNVAYNEKEFAPFIFGALTFFLPCGFTQALQLYVLSKGDFISGAIIMFVFALGTMPALLSISALSAFIKGKFKERFFRFAGAVVLILGIANISNGMALINFKFPEISFGKVYTIGNDFSLQQETTAPLAEINDGIQVIKMKINGLDFLPHRFKVRQGMPVVWEIDASKAAGCAQILTVPSLKINKLLLTDKPNIIEFTPDKIGNIAFSCAMGMTTRGAAIQVIAPN